MKACHCKAEQNHDFRSNLAMVFGSDKDLQKVWVEPVGIVGHAGVVVLLPQLGPGNILIRNHWNPKKDRHIWFGIRPELSKQVKLVASELRPLTNQANGFGLSSEASEASSFGASPTKNGASGSARSS